MYPNRFDVRGDWDYLTSEGKTTDPICFVMYNREAEVKTTHQRSKWIKGALAASLLIPLLLWLTGCRLFNVAPIAAFTISAQSGQAPLEVNFSAVLSSDQDGIIVQYDWDFGDGTSGSGETVSHTFGAAGTFTVVLRVIDDRGDSATNSKAIYVSPAEPAGPTASFTASPTSGTSPMTVWVDAASSSYDDGAISQYRWDWGDGATGFGRTASHTYFTTGNQTFTITLTVTGTDGKTGTATRTVTASGTGGGAGDGRDPGDPSARFDYDEDDIRDDPVVNFYTNDDVAPLRLWFDPTDTEADTGRVITAYIWSYGDGTSDNTIAPTILDHTFITSEDTETFSVTLIVTDDGNPAGSDTITKTVRVENYQPTAGFEVYKDLDDDGDVTTEPVFVPADWITGLDEDDGDNDDDRVSFYGVDPAAGVAPGGENVVWVRTQEIVDADWLLMDVVDPIPNGENDEPAEFDEDNGNNMCFDPEGQTWAAPGDEPDWFPNRAWGIERIRVNWGDGNIQFFPFQDAADTVAGHAYDFTSGNVKSWTITVTAYDYLGASASFSRVITFNEGAAP